ncbi:MAG: endonuclease [Rhodothermaceae bacterium]|nr:MAG: endonuclease [Rhodothermaceae bacterium]
MRPLVVLLALPLLLTAAHAPSVRWGQDGHRIVGQIAWRHLTPAAARAVNDLLGPGPMRLAEAGTWADEIRSDPAWRFAGPWHYITVEDDSTFDALPPVPESMHAIRNIVDALLYFERVLADTTAPRQDRANALRFFVHFVGDIHQPLHVGRGPDRGGNDVAIHWFSQESNLHRVWDTHLIEHQNLSFSEFVAFLDHATPEQIEAWQRATYLDWVHESKALRDSVYDFRDGTLDAALGGDYRDLTLRLGYDYAYRKTPLVKQRLLQAGIRLAGRLNALLDPAAR